MKVQRIRIYKHKFKIRILIFVTLSRGRAAHDPLESDKCCQQYGSNKNINFKIILCPDTAIAKANHAFEMSFITLFAVALTKLCTTPHRVVIKHAVSLIQ